MGQKKWVSLYLYLFHRADVLGWSLLGHFCNGALVFVFRVSLDLSLWKLIFFVLEVLSAMVHILKKCLSSCECSRYVHKSLNASVPYPTMHHLLQNGAMWDIWCTVGFIRWIYCWSLNVSIINICIIPSKPMTGTATSGWASFWNIHNGLAAGEWGVHFVYIYIIWKHCHPSALCVVLSAEFTVNWYLVTTPNYISIG